MKKALFLFLSCAILLSLAAAGQKTTMPGHGAHGPDDNELSVFYESNQPYVEHRGKDNIVINMPALGQQDELGGLAVQGGKSAIFEQSETGQGPTGAAVSEPVTKDIYVPVVILLFALVAFFITAKTKIAAKTKIFVTVMIISAGIVGITLSAKTQPTGLAIEGFPESINSDCFVVTIGLNTYTFCPEGGAPECSDGVDNADFEDSLVDCADPGCHSDGDASNAASCDPTDDFEQDMLEYDHAPVVDNQIDVYDAVNWVQYFSGDTSVLINCVTPSCSSSGANCVGDVDPDDNGLINAADMAFLQTTELADSDSRTVPLGGPICFNP